TEMAIHIGHRRAGWAGLLVAGVCFILPAFLIVMACGWMYLRLGKLPPTQAVLYGVKPVIIAIVGQAICGLAQSALKNKWFVLLGLATGVLSAEGVNELVILLSAGFTVILARTPRSRATHFFALGLWGGNWLPPSAMLAALVSSANVPCGLWRLFLF